jgi:predicted nucleic acid-binding protein
LRGKPCVYAALSRDKRVKLSMSTITMMELGRGAIDKREIRHIQKIFKGIDIVYINEDISKLAESLVIDYSKSHNLQICDALIAATSVKNGGELITYNISDFKFIPNIQLYQFDKAEQ